MPERRDPPPTDEGWYALHDFRSIDWDAWRDATERERGRAVKEAVGHLRSHLAVEDAEEGASALYSVLGHKADLLFLHLRPTTADVGAIERRFEGTEFARFTDRTHSFVSVTEASGYSERARDYFTDDLDEDSGLYNYIQTRLHPTIPDVTHVCFYPMDKRRRPDQNWYDLGFDERADHMDAHGEIGRDYGGKVTQMITGAIGIDDWEWGVTLWGDELTDVKELLYEMRFDPSTSQFAEFGSFYVGRRFPPEDLEALLAGERVPAGGESDGSDRDGSIQSADPADTDDDHDETHAAAAHGDSGSVESPDGGRGGDGDHHAGADAGSPTDGDHPHDSDGSGSGEQEDVGGLLATLGLQAGDDYGAGDYGLVLYSTADAQELAAEVEELRESFEHYDSHVTTVVRAHGGRSAVASIWDGERAADTAHGFLTDLSAVTETVRGPLGGDADGGPPVSEGEQAASGGSSAAAGEEAAAGSDDAQGIREELADLDVYAGQPHGEDVYALVCYSEADREELLAAVADLSDGFDRYDTHEGTDVYEDPDGGPGAVVSLWETEEAADTASGYLADLPDVVGWGGEGDGFGTMGMFYTVKPEYREEFVDTFEQVGELLAEMDGHRTTKLLVDADDENDMFIASQWDSKEDAMEFFRSDAFADTVDWGRDVLADRPRHVFLA